MVYLPVRAKIDVDEVPRFIKDTEQFVLEWMNQVMRGLRNESFQVGPRLATQRMPSGGGSYLHRFRWRDVQRTRAELISDFYNDHQWAKAVEGGTREHRIPKSGHKLMRAYPILPNPEQGKGRPYGVFL